MNLKIQMLAINQLKILRIDSQISATLRAGSSAIDFTHLGHQKCFGAK